MTNDSGTALATISQTGEVPETRASDPTMIQQAVQNLIQKDSKRSFKRSRLNGLVDGNPPFSNAKLVELGRKDATNANWGTARAYMESGSGSFYDLVSESPGQFKARTTYGTPEQQEEWSRGMSLFADEALEESKVWDFSTQVSIWDMTLHGCGPFLFEDEFQVLPKAFLCDDLKVPEFTKSDTEYWDQCAVIASYYPPQLYEFIRDEKAAAARDWRVEYTKKVIANAMDLRVAQSTSNMWVFCQQELKNNAMAYYDDTKVCRLAHVFWKEFNGRITHVIVPVTAGQGGTKVEFLFHSVGRYASFKECIHPMYWDHGNGGFHHSVTGFGVKMYKAMWEHNNMFCNLVDKAKAPKILFKPTSTESSQKFSLVTFGDYGVLPANFDWQQTGVAGLLNDGLAMNREIGELMQSNLSTYRQPLMKQEGNPITASQVNWQASQQSSLSKTQYNRYYEQRDMLLAEIFRRMCISGSSDPIAKKFQEKCKNAGIPKAAYEKTTVTSVRVVGQGSAFMRQQSLGKLWITLGPGLPEDGRANLADDMIAAEAGQAAVARYNPKRTRLTLASDQEAEAQQWVGIMKTGVPPKITSSQNPVIFATIWLSAAAQALESLSQGANAMEVLAFLEIIGPSIRAQLDRFAQDQSRQQVFKQMDEQWRELVQATDMLKQQIQAQLEAQEAQQQKTRQVMTDEQLKELEMHSNIRRKDIVTDSRLRQNDAKLRQSLAFDAEQHRQRLALADASTASEITLKQAKAATPTNGE